VVVAQPPRFGERLRRSRTAAGLTRGALVARAGIDVGELAALERGARRQPRPETVRRLAEALGLGGPGTPS
jgi:transcriptional regulator with XRE-family HTH domain